MLTAGNKLLDTIEKIELTINDATLSNTLSISDLNEIITNSGGVTLSNSGKFQLLQKFTSVRVKNFVYSFNDLEDNYMKLSEFRLEGREQIIYLKNLDYYKRNRYNYSLLDKLEFLLRNGDELYVKLSNSNIYIQMNLVDRLINFCTEDNFLGKLLHKYSSDETKEKHTVKFYDRFKVVDVKLKNFYFNLINNNNKVVYTVGASLLNFDIDKSRSIGKKIEFLFKLEYFIVFQSKLETNR